MKKSAFSFADLLPELLQHRQVELVEEAEGQSSPVGHHAARRRGIQGHLAGQRGARLLQQLLPPPPGDITRG